MFAISAKETCSSLATTGVSAMILPSSSLAISAAGLIRGRIGHEACHERRSNHRFSRPFP